LLKLFCQFMFWINGWKLTGTLSADITKCIIVAGPHTSNYDLIYALAGLYKVRPKVNYLLKKDWIDAFLIGNLFKKTGAIGVNRSKSNTMVDALADFIINSKEDIYLMISPEGTRKLTKRWKTGFYHIALKAQIPLVLTSLDYAKKEAAVGPVIMPTGCFEEDMALVMDYYKTITPKFPEKFSLQICEPEESAVCTG
jgi:1-acyl-sn-glycerol-3-phosphate acyltransferase